MFLEDITVENKELATTKKTPMTKKQLQDYRIED